MSSPRDIGHSDIPGFSEPEIRKRELDVLAKEAEAAEDSDAVNEIKALLNDFEALSARVEKIRRKLSQRLEVKPRVPYFLHLDQAINAFRMELALEGQSSVQSRAQILELFKTFCAGANPPIIITNVRRDQRMMPDSSAITPSTILFSAEDRGKILQMGVNFFDINQQEGVFNYSNGCEMTAVIFESHGELWLQISREELGLE